jgi:hypothetical protein
MRKPIKAIPEDAYSLGTNGGDGCTSEIFVDAERRFYVKEEDEMPEGGTGETRILQLGEKDVVRYYCSEWMGRNALAQVILRMLKPRRKAVAR